LAGSGFPRFTAVVSLMFSADTSVNNNINADSIFANHSRALSKSRATDVMILKAFSPKHFGKKIGVFDSKKLN
jgi:hypothetical protein